MSNTPRLELNIYSFQVRSSKRAQSDPIPINQFFSRFSSRWQSPFVGLVELFIKQIDNKIYKKKVWGAFCLTRKFVRLNVFLILCSMAELLDLFRVL